MNDGLTILYVEDEDGIRNQLTKFLKYFSTSLYLASNGKEGLALYKEYNPDIVISDIKMPIMDGIEMVKSIKKINPKQHVVFITAHSESEFFINAIDMHVNGYILKPVNLDTLEAKLEEIKEHIELKRYYIKHQRELEERAYKDGLTQIYNRRYFEEEFDREIARYKREKTPLSIFMFDIDKFKHINDTYGHQRGDDILKELVILIKNNIRAIDIFARWGGEEFISILPNTILKDAILVAEHLKKIIENYKFIDNIKVTCSFGVAEFKQNDTKETIVKKVDKALYRAKERGRNRVEG